MKDWVTNNYPGTKTAITEYNWGGQEHINGALAQADILGIFGREGLDLGTLWGPPDPVKQLPGLNAFLVYRNYDALLEYNCAHSYAIGVALLIDALTPGAPPIAKAVATKTRRPARRRPSRKS